tara:strand:+ start:37 stop:525 length:489 start_codon:yes stop_codon:yes gene_type:complete
MIGFPDPEGVFWPQARSTSPAHQVEVPSVAKKTAKTDDEVQIDRRSTDARRMGEDRRKQNVDVNEERRSDDRRKVTRRRQIDPTTCERDYSNDEIEFMHALDAYKRANGRMFPTCSEILEVIRKLGYEKKNLSELPLIVDVHSVDIQTSVDSTFTETITETI